MSDLKRENPIGIFDSGVGGLTVFRAVSELLPAENLVYLGDTARVPYGIRSPETVTRYAFECTEFLLWKEIKLLIIACNTVSSIAIGKIRAAIPVHVVGVIEPGADASVRMSTNGRIGVIGTEATIRSTAYEKAILHRNPAAGVFGRACPLFVPLVEEGWTDGEIAYLVADRYLSGLKNTGIDTLVLGCTHYPLLKGVIESVMGGVTLIDSAIETAKVVRSRLGESGLLNESGTPGQKKFYVTDSPERFTTVGEAFLGSTIGEIEQIQWG